MTTLFKTLSTSHSTCFLKRCSHLTSTCNSYEGDGKTTVSILNKNYDFGLMIDHISEHGFILNNGIRAVGPMILFPKTMLSWNIGSSTDMNEDSFSLLLNLEPRLDILVIGLDDKYPYNAPFVLNIKDLFKKQKISTEILPIYHACSTFNFLNSENRYAAAALIPPKIKYVEDILMQDRIEKHEVPQIEAVTTLEDQEDLDPLVSHMYNRMSRELKEKRIKETYTKRQPWRKEAKPDKISSSSNKDNKTS